jgi:hypothetical protein
MRRPMHIKIRFLSNDDSFKFGFNLSQILFHITACFIGSKYIKESYHKSHSSHLSAQSMTYPIAKRRAGSKFCTTISIRNKKILSIMKQVMNRQMIAMMLFLLSNTALAQENKNTFSLQYGVGYIARQDLVFSPFVHQSTTPLQIGIGYARRAKWRQEIKLRFASFNAALTASYTYRLDGANEQRYPHNFTLIDFDYTLGKPIGS